MRFKEYKILFYRLLLVYVAYFLARLAFFGFNHSHLIVDGISDLARLCFYGLLFDTTAIIYVNLLFIFLSILPLKVNTQGWYQKVLFWCYFLMNIPAFLLNFINIAYFSYNKTGLTTNDWALVQHEENALGLLMGFLVRYWLIFLCFLVLCVLWVMAYKRIGIAHRAVVRPLRYFTTSVVFILVLAPVLVFGIRGMNFSPGVVPLSVIDAGKYARDISQVHLLLNAPFSVIRTMNKNKTFREYNFTDEKYIEANIKPIKQYKRIVTEKPNVVLIILEGMGAEYFGLLNEGLPIEGYKGYTPFLDSLARKGFYFSNIYSNSVHSIEGISAVTAGMPTFQKPFVNSAYAPQRSLASIAWVARDLGYETLFAHGATNGSMSIDAFARQVGYERYVGRTEFNDDRYYNGKWGIDDEPFLQYFAKEINKMKVPFLATVFTLSSHEPYIVPEPHKGRFNKGAMEMHNVVAYTDFAISRFFETVKKEAWYENTIFAIIPDHTTVDYYPYYQQKITHHRIPIILYSANKTLIPQGHSAVLGQQIDLFPTLADLMGYQKPFRSWGRSLMSTIADETPRAYVTNAQFYQLMQGNYTYVLDPNGEVVGVYAIDDYNLSKNLKDAQGNNEEIKKGIADMRAFIQDYNDRIINDKLK
ncbi:arylsulfatase [Capnocytophaga sp. oral taxon 332 str. F0381]|uniref:LTA synthase family protein n=1 Tax=Capnocytophaga sp. oral taxon 332 TaxID=712213 RepID=UPI0002A426F6|nr:alkaline phosphatase family protein [Capnocytophaga sp. oral taxon 332]EKY11475.1 arylsulfatase [Capnocytophaga sp. oral taxon 332 str. F0381]